MPTTASKVTTARRSKPSAAASQRSSQSTLSEKQASKDRSAAYGSAPVDQRLRHRRDDPIGRPAHQRPRPAEALQAPPRETGPHSRLHRRPPAVNDRGSAPAAAKAPDRGQPPRPLAVKGPAGL